MKDPAVVVERFNPKTGSPEALRFLPLVRATRHSMLGGDGGVLLAVTGGADGDRIHVVDAFGQRTVAVVVTTGRIEPLDRVVVCDYVEVK